jgi:hypothetical protein
VARETPQCLNAGQGNFRQERVINALFGNVIHLMNIFLHHLLTYFDNDCHFCLQINVGIFSRNTFLSWEFSKNLGFLGIVVSKRLTGRFYENCNVN